MYPERDRQTLEFAAKLLLIQCIRNSDKSKVIVKLSWIYYSNQQSPGNFHNKIKSKFRNVFAYK